MNEKEQEILYAAYRSMSDTICRANGYKGFLDSVRRRQKIDASYFGKNGATIRLDDGISMYMPLDVLIPLIEPMIESMIEKAEQELKAMSFPKVSS